MQSNGETSATRGTYDRILNAAAECMLQNGYRDTRMTAIADLSGISRAALYKYFRTKDSILLELNKRVLEEAVESSREISASTEPALDVIERWLSKYLDAEQSGFVRAIMIADAQRVLIRGGRATDEALDFVRKALSKVIRRGIKAGDIRADIKPVDTAFMLQGLVFSVKRNYLSERPVIELSDRKYHHLIVKILIDGLRA